VVKVVPTLDLLRMTVVVQGVVPSTSKGADDSKQGGK
jgi:hypothetical protein